MSAAYAIESVETSLFDEADAKYLEIKSFVESVEWSSMPHDEVERLLESHGRELLRRLYQDHITLRGWEDVDETVVGSDGVQRTHSRERGRTISSIFGPVFLERAAHSFPGSTSLCPVDADLNLPKESYSLEVRRRAADRVAQNSFDEATRVLRETTGANVGKRQVEQLARRAAVDFERFYEETALVIPPEETSEILVVSIDMKGVVVRHEDLREKARKAAKKKPRLDKRRTVVDRRNRKRMSLVAAVYTIAPWVRSPEQLLAGLRGLRDGNDGLTPRPKPESKRIWASIVNESETVVDQAFQEALMRDPERKKRWVVLVDGDRKQLCWIKRAAKRYRVKITIILDIIHVIEYLWIAAHAFHGSGTKEAEEYVAKRLLATLEGRAGWVAGGMRRAARSRGLPELRLKRVEKCANYLKNYSTYLRYDRALADGLPIGTGVIEGACRYLVSDRLDITGARWSLEGAEAVLRLRALRASGDFDDYWDFHREQEYQRNHASSYASGHHPELVAPTRHGHLRLVI